MKDSAFSTVQDVLRHCIHVLPIALFLGRVSVEGEKQTSLLSSLLGLSAALEIFFYYSSSTRVVQSVRYIETLISSWSLSPVLLNLVLGGEQRHSWAVLACGLLPLALPYETLTSFIAKRDHLLLLLTFSINLVCVVSHLTSISVWFLSVLVAVSFLLSLAFHYLSVHEKTLLYSTYAFLLCDLFLNQRLTQHIAASEAFSSHAYLVVFEVSLFSLSVMLLCTVCLSYAVEYLWQLRESAYRIINRAVVTVDVVGIVSIGFVIPRLTHILGVDPFFWLLQVFSRDSFIAVYVAAAWILTIIAFILFSDWAMIQWNLSKNHGRKIFHAMVLVMFVPALWQQTLLGFTALSFGGACCIFVLVEFIRVFVCLGRLKAINQYFEMFISGNELQQKRRVILSHTSLLVGCATPLWIWSVNSHYDKVLAYMGLIGLGVGDAVAAVVGSLYGKKTWKDSRKTYLGSIAALISMVLFALAIIAFDPAVSMNAMEKVVIVSMSLVLAEVMLEGNDNFTLPLFGVIVYILL